jgi:hypothetical protein
MPAREAIAATHQLSKAIVRDAENQIEYVFNTLFYLILIHLFPVLRSTKNVDMLKQLIVRERHSRVGTGPMLSASMAWPAAGDDPVPAGVVRPKRATRGGKARGYNPIGSLRPPILARRMLCIAN